MDTNSFPTKFHVKKFKYNGFGVTHGKGFYTWLISRFVQYTNDPGMVEFLCSDNETRLIPTCCISSELYKELPIAPDLRPLEGVGVLFGTPSNPT